MRTRLIRAVVAGLLGTVAMNLMAYTAYPLVLGGVPLDLAAMLGSMLGDNWIAGLIADFALGTLILPVLYVWRFRRAAPGRAVARGTMWGALVWLVAQAVVSPAAGGGFFSRWAGGIPVIIGSLIGMLIYGYGFGVVFDGPPRPASVAEPVGDETIHIRRAS